MTITHMDKSVWSAENLNKTSDYHLQSVWSAENLNKTSDYHLQRTLINIEKKFSQDWSAEDQAYWTIYYNKVEEELINRGIYE